MSTNSRSRLLGLGHWINSIIDMVSFWSLTAFITFTVWHTAVRRFLRMSVYCVLICAWCFLWAESETVICDIQHPVEYLMTSCSGSWTAEDHESEHHSHFKSSAVFASLQSYWYTKVRTSVIDINTYSYALGRCFYPKWVRVSPESVDLEIWLRLFWRLLDLNQSGSDTRSSSWSWMLVQLH